MPHNKYINAQITDVRGGLMLQEKWPINKGIVNRRVDVNQLQSGLYFLYLRVEGKQYIRKFVVAK